MAPKSSTSSPKKISSLQPKLSFKPTKRDAAPIKAKAKATAKAKSKAKQVELPEELESDSESVDSDGSSFHEITDPEDDIASSPRHLDVHDKANRYKRYYKQTRRLMNNQAPIHFEDRPKIYQMLRVFDNTYEFGPCIGMSRLERWGRAQALGLNPPPEVRHILLTQEGQEDVELAHSVFHGRVLC